MKLITVVVNLDPEKFENSVNRSLSEIQKQGSLKELIDIEYKPLMADKILCHTAMITYKTIDNANNVEHSPIPTNA